MGNSRIAKDLVHLFECAALGFRIEKQVAEGGDEIEDEESIEVVKADVTQGDGTALREEQIQALPKRISIRARKCFGRCLPS